MAKSFIPGPSIVTTKNETGQTLKSGSQTIKLIGNVTGSIINNEVVYDIGSGSPITGTPLRVLAFNQSGQLLTNAKLTFDGSLNAATDNIIQKFTTAERDSLTPVVNMLIYNLTTNTFQIWNGSQWINTLASATITGTANKVLMFDNSGNLNTNSNLIYDSNNNFYSNSNSINPTGNNNNLLFGIGNNTSTNTIRSFAIGETNALTGKIAIALGKGLNCTAQNSSDVPKIAIGQYNKQESFTLFEVGFGTSDLIAERKNAIDVHYQTGLTRLHQMALKGDINALTLSNNFTIGLTNSFQKYTATSNVTSNSSTAIQSPSNTTYSVGQILIIENIPSSSGSLIFKNGANVRLPNNIDFTLTPGSSIAFIWDGYIWITIFSSTN